MTARHDARVVQLKNRRTAFTRTAPLSSPLDEALARAGVTLRPSPRESVCKLGAALRTFGREMRTSAGLWLSAHRLGFVERANIAGYVDGYRDGLDASPRRSA